jgi:3-oxoacyl-(acyl-carrier-protein) synthase
VDAAKRSRANYRYALTNSFGIGGNNVAVVFGAY